MSRHLKLDDRLYDYIVDHSLRDHPVLAQLRKITAGMKWGGMQIGPDQGQFMQLLVKLVGARNCIEIGVFTGYSSLAVALALPPGGKIVACDVSEEWTAIGREHWKKAGVEDRIDLRLGPATETLDALLAGGGAGKYDFAFIDADKPSYLAYYERCLKLLRAGGLIAIDNTLWSGDVAKPDKTDENTVAIRAVNDALHRDERIDVALLPVGDGVTLARKR
ncbi:MAG TPA: class I SAM-dependent methyltransferase [Usitatibacter sp.]|nr:class I SAM-dependent methyltransferase [Usitatibacter sp.]